MKSSAKDKWRARKQQERLERKRVREQREREQLAQEEIALQNRAWGNASGLNRIRENGVGVPVNGQAFALVRR